MSSLPLSLPAALAGALLAVPVYFLGRRVAGGDRAVGVLAAVLVATSAESFYLSTEFVNNSLALTLAACTDDTGGDTVVPETTAVSTAATSTTATTSDETALPDGPQGTEFAVTDIIPVGGKPIGVAVSADALWVINSRTVSRIDPDRLIVTDIIPVGVRPTEMGVSDDAAWVAHVDGRCCASAATVTETTPRSADRIRCRAALVRTQ